MQDGYKLGDVPHTLQVVNGIIQVSLSLFVKVDQSRRTCGDTLLLPTLVYYDKALMRL